MIEGQKRLFPFWRVTSHQLTLMGSYSPSVLRHLLFVLVFVLPFPTFSCHLLLKPFMSHSLHLSGAFLLFLPHICLSLVTSSSLSSSHNNTSLSPPIFRLAQVFPLELFTSLLLRDLWYSFERWTSLHCFVCACAFMHPHTVYEHHLCMRNQKCVFILCRSMYHCLILLYTALCVSIY